LLNQIKDISENQLRFIINHGSITAPFFSREKILKDVILEKDKNPIESLTDFVKLYTLAESGDIRSLNELKRRFKRIDEKSGGYAVGDRIISRLRNTWGMYKGILKRSIENTADLKEKEILMAAIQNNISR